MSEQSPWTQQHAHLHQTLRTRNLLERGQRILMAVSGGQDSVCLATLLLDLQPKWDWDLAIAHCDHRWRTDSAANAVFVQDLAARWQIPCFQRTADSVAANEAAARDWRYQSFTEIAQDNGYSHVVTGHTASDRAETLLYNLVRGSGADGLQALAWRRSLTPAIQLVRPLLNVTRAETAEFCRQRAIAIWEDSTNQDTQFTRNRIRLELLPYLKEHLNPQAELALAQTAELLQAEVEYLEAETNRLWSAVAESSPDDDYPLRLNRDRLKSVPLALQRRLIRRFLQQTLQISPNFDQIEKLRGLIAAANRTQSDPLPGGAIASVEHTWILLKLPERR